MSIIVTPPRFFVLLNNYYGNIGKTGYQWVEFVEQCRNGNKIPPLEGQSGNGAKRLPVVFSSKTVYNRDDMSEHFLL
ncbi:hypothetical protein [Geobacillus uzenensis]|uniref:hypothetical protein n=1 Tax=Geobacillus uzenensis TaxID=129339 RepID=UPI000A5B840D|nr:hypothetical protein [Geobacillus uzenensis]